MPTPSPEHFTMAQASSQSHTIEPIFIPALKVGALTGCSGFFLGGVTAVLRSNPTVGLFAMGMGLNCFALGTTYSATRSTMFRALHDPNSESAMGFTPREKVYISGISGALTGFSLGLVLRGRSNAIPGAIMWGLLGLGGQAAYNAVDARHTQEVTSASSALQDNLLDRAFRSKWNPIKKLSNAEYEEMLNGKLLALDAEIAITNEEIEKLKKRIKPTRN